MTTPHLASAGNGRYRVSWTEDRKRRQRTFADLGDARRFHTVQTYLSVESPAPAASMTVAELVAQWVKGRPVAPATARRIESTRLRLLEPFFGTRLVADISAQQISGWVHWLREEHGYSPATVRQHFCVLRSALQWAVNTWMISRNPCHAVALPRVPRAQRAAALTRLPKPRYVRASAGHHRDCAPLADLRRAVSSTASAAELAELLRHLAVDPDAD